MLWKEFLRKCSRNLMYAFLLLSLRPFIPWRMSSFISPLEFLPSGVCLGVSKYFARSPMMSSGLGGIIPISIIPCLEVNNWLVERCNCMFLLVVLALLDRSVIVTVTYL